MEESEAAVPLKNISNSIIVREVSVPKNFPISPVNDQKCMEETPLTSTPHCINPFLKSGKRSNKSISEKINEIVVENVEDKNNVEEITNHISCEKTDFTSSTQMSSKVSKKQKKHSPIKFVSEEESKKTKESAMNVCFVSDDPCENEDNNNPEWLALKKLETDEARYKAVRMRWKNLTIPDPNKNLTYIQIKPCFKRTSAPENVEVRKVSHKRAFSYEPSISTEDLPPAKRSRTRSCTTLYDKKIEDHWRKMEEKEKDLLADKEKSLWDVRSRFNKARNRLRDSGLLFLNYREYDKRLNQLRSQQRQDIEEIYRKYLNAKMELENEGHKKSKIFNAALEEVKAFHNFYSNLDDKVSDCYFLTEPELEDVEDTNRLYQKFSSFYSH